MSIPGRYTLVLWTFSLSVLLYVDRICISTAKNAIQTDLGFDDRQMGWIMSIFALGYAINQTPGGWFADRLGPRLALSVIVVFWSFFTGLTAMVTGWWNMLITRFLFGIGEAGAFPGLARVLYSWIPISERGVIQGINSSGSRIGGAASLAILPLLIEQVGWRGSFLFLMAIGFLWAVGWFWWFRDDPADHSWISSDELAHIAANRQPPAAVEISPNEQATNRASATDSPTASDRFALDSLAWSANMWFVSAQYFCSNFTFFFCLTWLLPHLSRTYQLSGVEAGLYSAAPLICGAFGNWLAGWLADRIYRAGYWTASRRIPALLGFSLAVLGVLGSASSTTAVTSIAWFSLAIFGSDMTIAPSWLVCIDIGKKHAGIVSGTMNMAGNIGSFVTSLAFPYLAAWTGSYTPFFYVAAGLNLLAIPTWLLIDCHRALKGAA